MKVKQGSGLLEIRGSGNEGPGTQLGRTMSSLKARARILGLVAELESFMAREGEHALGIQRDALLTLDSLPLHLDPQSLSFWQARNVLDKARCASTPGNPLREGPPCKRPTHVSAQQPRKGDTIPNPNSEPRVQIPEKPSAHARSLNDLIPMEDCPARSSCSINLTDGTPACIASRLSSVEERAANFPAIERVLLARGRGSRAANEDVESCSAAAPCDTQRASRHELPPRSAADPPAPLETLHLCAVRIQALVRGHLVRASRRQAWSLTRRVCLQWGAWASARRRMRQALNHKKLRYGRWLHLHLNRTFDEEQLEQEEGKAAVATQHRLWRLKARAWTRWLDFCFEGSSAETDE